MSNPTPIVPTPGPTPISAQTNTLSTVQRIEADLAIVKTWMVAHVTISAVLIAIIVTLLVVKIL